MDADGFRPNQNPAIADDIKSNGAILMTTDFKTEPLASPPISYGEASDAVPLHYSSSSAPAAAPSSSSSQSQSHRHSDRFFDDDPPELHADDLPPLYSDHADADGSEAGRLLPLGPPPDPLAPRPLMQIKASNGGDEYYLDGRLDADPEFLARQVENWARCPPRPFVQVRGTHTETTTRREHHHGGKDKNKTETTTVVDFDVLVELTPFLYRDINRGEAWNELRTVDNGERARRGGVFPSRAPGYDALGVKKGGIHLEAGVLDAAKKPGLMEWCHRYCASHAAMKSFVLRRRVVGFDEAAVRERLVGLVRSTQYRGSLDVAFPVRDANIHVYNDVALNRWRFTMWVRWFFYLTLLFLIAWPCLFFATRQFEVVVAEWHFSRPRQRQTGDGGEARRFVGDDREFVSVSEAQFYNMWARAIQRAVLDKRQGTLDQADLRAAEVQGPSFEGLGEGAAADVLRAGINAMGVVNRQFGWGGNS